MKKLILVIIAATVLAAGAARAQQTVGKYVAETEYLIYFPEGYHTDTKTLWPLVVFLHGAAETGDDIEMLKRNGVPRLIHEGRQFPFIAVSPQLKTRGWNPDLVVAITEQVASTYRVDRDRLYLTGLSMGGFGTWTTAQMYPGIFAAIVPICGGGIPDRAHTLVTTPVWNFHGDRDNIVSIDYSDQIVNALRAYEPVDLQYTVYPGVLHNSWELAYEEEAMWEWLLSKRKFRFEPAELTPGELSLYEGEYESQYGYRVKFEQVEGGLHVTDGNSRDEILRPVAGGRFIGRPGMFDHYRFSRGDDGRITGVIHFAINMVERMEKLGDE